PQQAGATSPGPGALQGRIRGVGNGRKLPGFYGNVGARVYNMRSMGSVSLDPECLCDFPTAGRLNGVQEVAGSNPVAPTFASPTGTISSGWPFFAGRTHSDPRAEFRAEIRPLRTTRYPSSAP